MNTLRLVPYDPTGSPRHASRRPPPVCHQLLRHLLGSVSSSVQTHPLSCSMSMPAASIAVRQPQTDTARRVAAPHESAQAEDPGASRAGGMYMVPNTSLVTIGVNVAWGVSMSLRAELANHAYRVNEARAADGAGVGSASSPPATHLPIEAA